MHAFNRFLLRDAVAAAESRHAINFRKRARDDQVRMILHQRDHTLVAGAVGVMKVRFVHENRRFARSLRNEIAQSILGSDTGGGIVRVADINQTSFRSGKHFRQVMREGGGERHLHHFGAISVGIIEYCFESWIRGDKLSVSRSSKRFRA